jgi:hypothetical protein
MRYRQKGGSTSEALEEGGSIYLSRGWVKALSVEGYSKERETTPRGLRQVRSHS